MIPETAVIKSEKVIYRYSKRICGLYALERNILILSRAGIKRIILNLSDEELLFFRKKVKKHLKRIKDTDIIEGDKSNNVSDCLSISSNIFLQLHYLNDFDKHFTKEDDLYVPTGRNDQFLLISDSDYKRGSELAKSYIIENTGGFLAKKINKSISIPISLVLSNTRVHPNYLTLFNMIIGILSAVFLLMNSYWYIVLGGLFFQLASIFDGVDGEVAKFTFKVSKIGGWLDTISDNTTLLLFLIAASYLFFLNFEGFFAIIIIAVMFSGLIILLISMVAYLRRYSESGSLVAYDREFLQKLPESDILVVFIHRMKYFTKKEFFALFFFIITFTGRIDLIIPIIAVVLAIGGIILQILNRKYLNDFRDQV